jgi:serine/threonine-protein kinase
MTESARRLGELVDQKYVLLRVIGVGGMGVVFEAQHVYTEKRVALKLLTTRSTADAASMQRFLREARAFNAIRHPAIADVLDAGKDETGAHYLVFELLEGRDLQTALKEEAFEAREVVDIALEILDALVAAHAHGFVHRDLKPANIFLCASSSRRVAKLLDFGVAYRLRSYEPNKLTEAGRVLGTLYFMGPEHLAGEELDARADIWSLGAVMFYALTYEFPFRAKNPHALLAEMLNEGPRPLARLRPDLPSALVEAIERALSTSIEERFRSAGDMASALRSALPQAERVPPAWERALGEIRRETDALRARARIDDHRSRSKR